MAGIDFQYSPFFLAGTQGSLYVSAYYPLNPHDLSKKAIVHIPAFAEEMNKSRRMVALQAREFVKNGYAVFIIDLFGTGDSSGEFSEATWSQWQSDLNSLCEWLLDREYQSLIFWGLRTGSLLAMDFISENTLNVKQLICWQPVFSGETFVLQFLRLRTAAAMMNKNSPQEKVSDLKNQLLDGRSIEIAGYMLNPELACPMLKLNLKSLNIQDVEFISILEVVNNLDKKATALAIENYDFLKSQVKKLSEAKVLGSPFWSTQEITEVPGLLNETNNCLTLEG